MDGERASYARHGLGRIKTLHEDHAVMVTPPDQQVDQRLWRVCRCWLTGLVESIDAVTAIAGAHFAGFGIDPVALTNNGITVGAGELPTQGTLRRNKSGDGSIGSDFRGARCNASDDGLCGKCGGIVHQLRQYAAAWSHSGPPTNLPLTESVPGASRRPFT